MASQGVGKRERVASETRRHQRVKAEVRVRLSTNVRGITRDVSPNGVYFEIDQKLADGQVIRFAIEFDGPGGHPLHLNCVGKVVRVEESSGKVGVAVAIVESQLERR